MTMPLHVEEQSNKHHENTTTNGVKTLDNFTEVHGPSLRLSLGMSISTHSWGSPWGMPRMGPIERGFFPRHYKKKGF